MARKRSKILTEREFEVMDAIWELGEASVHQIREKMGNKDRAYTTVATIVAHLENKEVIKHRKQGRIYLFSPERTRENEQRSALSYVLYTFFGGDKSKMKDILNTIIQRKKNESN